MSYMGPPSRSPHQQTPQNNRSSPSGNFNQQRSPHLKKYHTAPAWGSGAVLSGSKHGNDMQSAHSFTSPPHYNVTSPPYDHRPPFPPFRSHMTSPRHNGSPFNPNNNRPFMGPNQFRTPQPMYRNRFSPQKSWTCDKNFRPGHKRLNMKSPRRDFNSNPGGSNDINIYYHPAMLADPWQNMTPVPVTHTPAATT